MKEKKDLRDFIDSIGKTKEGYVIDAIGDTDAFLKRYNAFKEFVATHLHDVSYQELINMHRQKDQLDLIYEWISVDHFIDALEYESLNNKLIKLIKANTYQ